MGGRIPALAGSDDLAEALSTRRNDRFHPIAVTPESESGYPERFAQQALGHSSKAVHSACSKRAEVTVPSLDDWDKEWQGQSGKQRQEFGTAEDGGGAHEAETPPAVILLQRAPPRRGMTCQRAERAGHPHSMAGGRSLKSGETRTAHSRPSAGLARVYHRLPRGRREASKDRVVFRQGAGGRGRFQARRICEMDLTGIRPWDGAEAQHKNRRGQA